MKESTADKKHLLQHFFRKRCMWKEATRGAILTERYHIRIVTQVEEGKIIYL